MINNCECKPPIDLGTLPFRKYPKDDCQTYIYYRPDSHLYLFRDGREKCLTNDTYSTIPILTVSDLPDIIPDPNSVIPYIKNNTLYLYLNDGSSIRPSGSGTSSDTYIFKVSNISSNDIVYDITNKYIKFTPNGYIDISIDSESSSSTNTDWDIDSLPYWINGNKINTSTIRLSMYEEYASDTDKNAVISFRQKTSDKLILFNVSIYKSSDITIVPNVLTLEPTAENKSITITTIEPFTIIKKV